MRKWKADLIHDGHQFKKNYVLITTEDGTVVNLVPEDGADTDASYFPGIICPGFVNTHCHLELSHLKGKIPEHTGLVSFLMTVMKDRNSFSKEEILQAAAIAEAEMMKNGIVAVGDIANGTDSLPIKRNSRLFYYTLVECMGITEKKAADAFQRSCDVLNSFKENGLTAALIPHAPYSVSRSLFQLINAHNKTLISIHNQETQAEDQLYKGEESSFYDMFDAFGLDYSDFQPTGKSSLSSFLSWFTYHQRLILVHNTFVDTKDIIRTQRSSHKVFWCLCPNANIYIENRLPPVIELMEQNATITLGTDSLASNHQLSILEEMKTLQKYLPELSLEEMLCWATSNGAKALHCEDQFGTFVKGKKPGIVWIKHTLKGDFPGIQAQSMAERLT